MDSGATVSGIEEGQRLIVTGCVAVLVSSSSQAELARRLGVCFFLNEHLAGGKVARAILRGNTG